MLDNIWNSSQISTDLKQIFSKISETDIRLLELEGDVHNREKHSKIERNPQGSRRRGRPKSSGEEMSLSIRRRTGFKLDSAAVCNQILCMLLCRAFN